MKQHYVLKISDDEPAVILHPGACLGVEFCSGHLREFRHQLPHLPLNRGLYELNEDEDLPEGNYHLLELDL